MHDGHDHPPRHRGPLRPGPAAGPGHNRARAVPTQWQVGATGSREPERQATDFDLVEAAFCRAAETATDATSLLRLARVPFAGIDRDGETLRLLSFRIEHEAEVGAIAPGFGADDVVYQPVPAARVRTVRRLRFVYHARGGLRELGLAEAQSIAPDGPTEGRNGER